MSNWNKLKKIVGLDKQESMNKEELTQEEINKETESTTAQENEQNEEVENPSIFQDIIDKVKNDFGFSQEEEEVEEAEKNPLQTTIDKLSTEKAELSDKYLRLSAEFQNYKRRTAREKMDIIQTAGREIIKNLLPVLDDFDRAKKAADDDESVEAFSEGVQLVYEKLHNVLKQKGLKALETNGEKFNPDFHEALTEIPAPNDDMKGKIIDTIESGYALNDKIIRYAKVVVGK